MKTDSLGTFQWAKAYGWAGIEEAADIICLPDSGFVLAGSSNSYTQNNDYNGYLIRTNKTGDTLWTLSVGSSEWDFIKDLELLPNGNLLITGSSNSTSNGLTAGWLGTISASGTPLSQHLFETGKNINLLKSAIDLNGSYFSCGFEEDPVTLARKGFAAKWNPLTADTIWTYRFPGNNQEEFRSVKVYPNGDAALCGTLIFPGSGDYDELAVRLDGNSGSQVWDNRAFATGNDQYHDLVLSGDTMMAAGATTSSGAGAKDFHYIRMDGAGQFIDATTFGAAQDEIAYHIESDSNGTFILGGITNSYGPGIQSMFLVRSDAAFTSVGNVTVGINELNKTFDCKLFPNPASGFVKIIPDGELSNSTDLIFEMYSAEGKLILMQELVNSDLTVDLHPVPEGFYYVLLRNANSYAGSMKLVITR